MEIFYFADQFAEYFIKIISIENEIVYFFPSGHLNDVINFNVKNKDTSLHTGMYRTMKKNTFEKYKIPSFNIKFKGLIKIDEKIIDLIINKKYKELKDISEQYGFIHFEWHYRKAMPAEGVILPLKMTRESFRNLQINKILD